MTKALVEDSNEQPKLGMHQDKVVSQGSRELMQESQGSPGGPEDFKTAIWGSLLAPYIVLVLLAFLLAPAPWLSRSLERCDTTLS